MTPGAEATTPSPGGAVASGGSLLAGGSGTAAAATTIGLLFGPVGLVGAVAIAVGSGAAGGALRWFAPRTAERLRLRRSPNGGPVRTARGVRAAGSSAPGGARRRVAGLLGRTRGAAR